MHGQICIYVSYYLQITLKKFFSVVDSEISQIVHS